MWQQWRRLGKGKTGGNLILPPKLVEKLVWVPVISFCKIFIPSYLLDALLWPPNRVTFRTRNFSVCFFLFFLHLFLCQILLLLLHCDAIAFLASASVGFLLLWVVLLNMTKNVCPSQEILNKITRCFKQKIQSLPNILGCQIGHPTSTDQPCASKLLHLYLWV